MVSSNVKLHFLFPKFVFLPLKRSESKKPITLVILCDLHEERLEKIDANKREVVLMTIQIK